MNKPDFPAGEIWEMLLDFDLIQLHKLHYSHRSCRTLSWRLKCQHVTVIKK